MNKMEHLCHLKQRCLKSSIRGDSKSRGSLLHINKADSGAFSLHENMKEKVICLRNLLFR